MPYDILTLINNKKNMKLMKNTNEKCSTFLPWNIMIPIVAYVVFYSILPHKELRFILPSVSGFNICSAFALSRFWELRKQYGSRSSNPWTKRLAEVRISFKYQPL